MHDSGHVLDPLIAAADRALRALLAPARSTRPVPGAPSEENPDPTPSLTPEEKREAGALMRVNHAGEVAAQALYHGQAFAARSAGTRTLLLKAATEEAEHLAWCRQRISELGSRRSLLDPLWYAGSFTIGALSALPGDRASLGFVVETERQVEGHLNEHLARLPAKDTRSRAILEAMRTEEVAHGTNARTAGAVNLPWPVRDLMRATAKVMTGTAYWL
jgi:ubiquinone biosynthesis monooxygenase Coq7